MKYQRRFPQLGTLPQTESAAEELDLDLDLVVANARQECGVDPCSTNEKGTQKTKQGVNFNNTRT